MSTIAALPLADVWPAEGRRVACLMRLGVDAQTGPCHGQIVSEIFREFQRKKIQRILVSGFCAWSIRLSCMVTMHSRHVGVHCLLQEKAPQACRVARRPLSTKDTITRGNSMYIHLCMVGRTAFSDIAFSVFGLRFRCGFRFHVLGLLII